MKNILNITKNIGNNQGYCVICKKYFKKGDYITLIEKGEINRIKYLKICVKCYINQLANKIGWEKLNKLILEMVEEKV